MQGGPYLIPLFDFSYRSPAEKLLRAHRIAAEVRDRRGMKVMKTCMATWAWTAE